MKKTLIFAMLGIFVLALSSCRKEPQASFTVSKQTAEVNETIIFNSTSTDAYSYEWNFGDGNVSTSQTAMHAYTAAGTYIVKLKALSKNGKKSDESTTIITVTASASNAVTHDGNTYTLSNGLIQDFGDYYGMGNGNYDIILYSPGITYSNNSLSGTGDIIYFELFAPLTGIVNSDYTFDPLNSHATFTFTASSGFFKGYNFQSGTSTESVSFNSGTVGITINGSQYQITINLMDSNGKAITGGYNGTLNYQDSSKSLQLKKLFKK